MGFADRVKRVKATKGLTSEQLAQISGVPIGTLTKLLSGVIEEPKLSVALSIAHALECPVGYLADEEGEFLTETLTEREHTLLTNFRALDPHGKELCEMVLEKEMERVGGTEESAALPDLGGDVCEGVHEKKMIAGHYILPLLDLPVSAGAGTFLEGEAKPLRTMRVKATKEAGEADFVLQISGDSMEPSFSDGDRILVRRQETVTVGKLGVFMGDGQGYFKRFTGNALHSLNPKYADIPISSFTEFACKGQVVGHLRKKNGKKY